MPAAISLSITFSSFHLFVLWKRREKPTPVTVEIVVAMITGTTISAAPSAWMEARMLITVDGSRVMDVVEIAQNAIKEAKAKGLDVVIVDTAGRLAVDEEMMNEIYTLKNSLHPDETLFVVDAMTGQDAVNTAKEFNDRLDFDGVVLTKLDGDTRGGAAISIRTVVSKPIKFVGTGEKMEAIDAFHPSRMADRILGMGDIVSLVERAQEQFDEEEARRLQKKIQKNKFDFNDFLGQIQQIKKMGNIKDLASMIPGVGKAIKEEARPARFGRRIGFGVQEACPPEAVRLLEFQDAGTKFDE